MGFCFINNGLVCSLLLCTSSLLDDRTFVICVDGFANVELELSAKCVLIT